MAVNYSTLLFSPIIIKHKKDKKHKKIWENTNLLAIVISPVSLLKMHLILRWENSAITPKGFWQIYYQIDSKIWEQSLSWQRPLRSDSSYFQMAFDRLFQVRLGYIGLGDCPTGLGNWPRRVRAPRRGQKQEKSYCKKKRRIAP